MTNKKLFRNYMLTSAIIIFLVISTIPIAINAIAENQGRVDSRNKNILLSQSFSNPIISEDNDYSNIFLEESNTWTLNPGEPMLPVYSKTFELPWGSKITGITHRISSSNLISLNKKIKPSPSYKIINSNQMTIKNEINSIIYESNELYPQSWYNVDKGAGINVKGEHVLFLSLKINPIRYYPSKEIIKSIDNIEIDIEYEESKTITFEDEFDLLIITPTIFSEKLIPLQEHKNNYGVKTKITDLDEIYSSQPGRDHQEQIKYYIKYALEKWGIEYVLLIGEIKKLPIRDTYAYPWNGWGDNILSDQYYADIYDEKFNFCSWDANENDKFGEVNYETHRFPPIMDDEDEVDLYADVKVGRIPCRTNEEIELVVNKIINYEKNTYDKNWFKKIILAGGDTFPPENGAPFFIYEGEITNKKVGEQLPDFTHIKLWSSKRNLNPISFNRAINKGAGFLSYAGHGFEHGWGTYPPNVIRDRLIVYYTPFLQFLRNKEKLPIIFFDACLTAKLDFNMTDMDRYYPKFVGLLERLAGFQYNPNNYYPCFAWSFINQRNGGAIATIGATRPAYTYVNQTGVYAGAGYLDVEFFKAYKEGRKISDMFTQSQNEYINNVGMDYFTIEEYLLIGDPSLRVGGYPQN